MIDCQIYGLRAGGHHLTNVLLHLCAVIALFLVLRSMTGAVWRSLFVAAVFAIHPLRVESVAWVTERKDVLCALFFILTIGAYARYARLRSAGRYALVVAMYALCLMSKPLALALPFVLLLLDYWPLGRFATVLDRGVGGRAGPVVARLVAEKLPIFALSALSCAVTVFTVENFLGPVYEIPAWMRAGNTMISAVRFVYQTFWPAGLGSWYPNPIGGPAIWKIVLAAGVLVSVSVAVILMRRRQPWLVTGWFWYLLMLTPLFMMTQARMDRFSYLPHIGLLMALTWSAAEITARWRHRRVILAAVMAASVAGLAFQTAFLTSFWKDSATLGVRTLAVTKNNAVGCNNLGAALFRQGRRAEAIKQYEEALRIDPGLAYAHNNLGSALMDLGRFPEAIEHLQQALLLKPDFAEARSNLGSALEDMGRVPEAIEQYRQSLQIKPDFAEAHCNLGSALAGLGRTEEAIRHYEMTLKLKPDYARAHYNFGNALNAIGRVPEAIGHYRKAVQINPGFSEAYCNLGIALAALDCIPEAVVQYQKSLELKPDCAEACNGMGVAMAGMDRVPEAMEYYRRALKINPDYANVHNNLGVALSGLGRIAEAVEHYEMALKVDSGYGAARTGLAWILATCPDAAFRDGVRAVALAGSAIRAGDSGDPIALRTLAAAYAEEKRFTDAITAALTSQRLAAGRNDTGLAAAVQVQIDCYRAARPFRAAGPAHRL